MHSGIIYFKVFYALAIFQISCSWIKSGKNISQTPVQESSVYAEPQIMAPNYCFEYFVKSLDNHFGWSHDSASQAEASDFKKSFHVRYTKFNPNDSLVQCIDKKLNAIHKDGYSIGIQIIGGNWCSDTQEGLPKLAKILDKMMFLTGSTYTSLLYMRVNREKKFIDTADVEVKEFLKENNSFTVGKVPLVRVIMYKPASTPMIIENPNGSIQRIIQKKEKRLLGEIVEIAYPSWELSILEILNKY